MSPGDTIIEVILAFTVFALLTVSTMYLMNRSLSVGQRSLEVTLVRQQIDTQAELLRIARDTNHPVWTQIREELAVDATTLSVDASFDRCPESYDELGAGAFVLSAQTGESSDTIQSTVLGNAASYAPAPYYSRVAPDESKSYGLWITPVRVEGASLETFDMYIRACWDSVGSTRPQSASTIVRLYAT